MASNPKAKAVLVCVAWPYANGSLHLGHLAGSLLPPDIFARYHRMAGNRVLMVSGSDCHGTPIMVTAEKQNTTPQAIVDKYHKEHVQSLKDLGIQFDLFTKTTTENHRKHVQDIFTTLLEQKYMEERETQGTYCPNEKRFLPDRYVEGVCPHCGKDGARGDQCDACGKTLDPTELKEPKCKHCGATPEVRPTKHFFFRLTAFEDRLKQWVKDKAHWRANTINFTNNWLSEGLKDRAISRDLTWGVPIPLKGYEDKRLYVWFEAVCGYLTASIEWAERIAKAPDSWKDWWLDPAATSYYFLGKDNIPFHTIIWPAILMGYSDGLVKHKKAPRPLNLPTDVPANEFLTLSGKQFSKSRGVGIQIPDILSKFDADTIRYYLSVNMPDQRDADWSWEDFAAKVNDELVGTFGNYVHRTLSFTHKHFGQVPPTDAQAAAKEQEAVAKIEEAVAEVAKLIEACDFKKAIRRAFALAQYANQYIDEVAPWKLVKQDKAACGSRLNVGLRLAKALAIMLQPFLPHTSQKLWQQLGENGAISAAKWSAALEPLPVGRALPEPQALIAKVDLAERLGAPAPAAAASAASPPATANVPLKEFQKIDLRIGKIVDVREHPDADKLYVLTLEGQDGHKRQLVAGLRGHYSAKELTGRTVAFIANLEPAKIRGVESQGMILAGDDGTLVSVLSPDKPLKAGAKIR
jgi:methionyl-tRNA synthetase